MSGPNFHGSPQKLPQPICCERAKRLNSYREPRIYWWVEPVVNDDGTQEMGWMMDGTFIEYCPWCGRILPAMQKKAQQSLMVTKCTDGGYYCDTCRERLMNCTCTWPGVDWEPVPNEPGPIEKWRRNNWAELQAHAGNNVAIHPTQGIVASGKLPDVIKRVRELGLSQEVVIERVRKT